MHTPNPCNPQVLQRLTGHLSMAKRAYLATDPKECKWASTQHDALSKLIPVMLQAFRCNMCCFLCVSLLATADTLMVPSACQLANVLWFVCIHTAGYHSKVLEKLSAGGRQMHMTCKLGYTRGQRLHSQNPPAKPTFN
jgi:hypothetical protein